MATKEKEQTLLGNGGGVNTTPMTVYQAAITRETFSSGEVERLDETSATASAAMVKAEVEARFIVAMKRPRDILEVHARLMQECKRPGFARAARYMRPVGSGKTADGPSIRFAEAAARCMGNIDIKISTVFDGPPTATQPGKRIVRAVVTDLESNASYASEIVLEKIVERKRPDKGARVFGERKNSYGEMVYIVEANEGDLRVKEAAEASKAMRTLILRLVPGDVIEDAMARVKLTLADDGAKDPDGDRKRLVEAFMVFGVKPSQIVERLGHPLEQLTPSERIELLAIHAAIKDGQSTWDDYDEPKDAIPAPERASAAKS